MSYATAREQLGQEAAEAYWRFTDRYVDRMEELAGDALRRVASLRLADDGELDDLRAEYEALDTRLVLGGRRDKSPDLEFSNEEVVTEPIQDELTRFAAEYWVGL
jgi:hypothetical protein